AQRGATYQRILEKYFPGTRVAPRSGSVSLARPFKAGTQNETNLLVASSTNESLGLQSSLTRRQEWDADVFPALKGSIGIVPLEEQSHFAPTELPYLLRAWTYKPFVPTGLATTNQRYLTISSEHFRVTYPTGVDHRDADQVLQTLETARSDYLHRANA